MNTLVVCLLVTLAAVNAKPHQGYSSSFLDYPTTRTDIFGPSAAIVQEENYSSLLHPAPVEEPIYEEVVVPAVHSAVIEQTRSFINHGSPVIRSGLYEHGSPVIRSGLYEHGSPVIRSGLYDHESPVIRSGLYDHGYETYGRSSSPWSPVGLSNNLFY